jgi:DNA-binding NarL/FixJ family response regulator
MIDVFVEASSPEAYAQIADLLRDSAQIRLIGADPGAPASSPEDALRPDVVVEVLEPIDPARASAESLSLNTGWSAAGVPVILLVDHLAQRLSGPLPPGVHALLPRNLTAAEIAGAIEAAAAGLYVFHPSDLESIDALRVRETDRASDPAPEFSEALFDPLLEPLTPREIEVLQLLSQGLGNKEIASRLGISEHTAKFHVASIMGKLGAATRTEAVTLGIRHGLVLI